MKPLSRREFLQAAGLAAMGLAVGACGPKEGPPLVPKPTTLAMKAPMMQTPRIARKKPAILPGPWTQKSTRNCSDQRSVFHRISQTSPRLMTTLILSCIKT